MDFFVARLMSLNEHELRCLRSDQELQNHLQRTHLLMESKLQQYSNGSLMGDNFALDLRVPDHQHFYQHQQQQQQQRKQQQQQQHLDHSSRLLELQHQHQQLQQFQLHQLEQQQQQQLQLEQQQQEQKCFNYKKMKFIEWHNNSGSSSSSSGSGDDSPTPPANQTTIATTTTSATTPTSLATNASKPSTSPTTAASTPALAHSSCSPTTILIHHSNATAAAAAAAATTTQTNNSPVLKAGKKYKGEFDEPSALEVELRVKLLMRLDNYHSIQSVRGECACILGSEFKDKSASSVLAMVEQWRQMPTEQRVNFKWDMNDLPKDIPLSDIKRFENLRREASSGRADFGGASKRKPLGIRGTRQFLLILYCLWGHPGRDDPMQREGYCPHCFACIKKPNEQSTLVRVVNHFNMKHRRGINPRT